MAAKKFTKRSEVLCENKERYVRNATIMAELKEEDVRIIKSKISEDRAKAILKNFIETSDITVKRGVKAKLIKALKNAGTPIMRKEYYSVIASYFHISGVEYEYSYMYNGNTIDINPEPKGANMDFSVFTETLDGRYCKTLCGPKKPMNVWNNLLEDECISDFEEGFVAHALMGEDYTRDSHLSMGMLNSMLRARVEEIVQGELGSKRPIVSLNLLNKEYTYTSYVFAAPFYVFQYDLGKQIVTITVDAYSGEVSTPIINNPLGIALYAPEDDEPDFNVFSLILHIFMPPIIGGVLYWMDYSKKKSKYKKSAYVKAPKYSIDELRALM